MACCSMQTVTACRSARLRIDVYKRQVETHRAHLFAKLETESLAQLIRGYAALVDDDPEHAGARTP